MRVSTKALAPAFLSLLAACATTTSPVPPVPLASVSPVVTPPAASLAPAPAASPVSFSFAPPQQGNYDTVTPPHERGNYTEAKTGRVSFLLGARELDEAFEPAEDPAVFGMEFNTVKQGGGLGFETGFLIGYDEADDIALGGGDVGDLETAQAELYAGLRLELGEGPIRPYIGGGGTWVSTETTVRIGALRASEDDSDFGAYAHAGIQADLTDNFFVGIDYRQTFDIDYEVDGEEFDGEYGQLTLVLGISF
ncbi:MAG: outer membrane beta-barrel protein [Planctomycetota bacterium]